MKRRTFLHISLASTLLWMLGLRRGAASNRLIFQRPIIITVQIGSLFPSLRLIRKLLAAEEPDQEPYVLSHTERPMKSGTTIAQMIDFAFVFPTSTRMRNLYQLRGHEHQFALQEIPRLLEREFGYHVVKMDLASDPSFWYPYLPGRVLCCRLRTTFRG